MPDRADTPGQSVTADCPGFVLTPRQRDVLELVAHGETGYAIARSLGITARTVRKHLLNARRRLNAQNTVHAVAIAISADLVSLRGPYLPRNRVNGTGTPVLW